MQKDTTVRKHKDTALREHLVELLKGGHAHADFKKVIEGFPVALRGKTPKDAEHSAWELLEHLRIAQWDILDFSRNPKYKERKWPEGYWPETAAPADDQAWTRACALSRGICRRCVN